MSEDEKDGFWHVLLLFIFLFVVVPAFLTLLLTSLFGR